MPAERIPVAPGVLTWARRSAGYSDIELAARRLSVKPDQIEKWESEDLDPTITQLRNMAKLYHRPLAVLLLPEAPTDFDAMRDFRRTGSEGPPAWSPALHSEFKRALSQREVLLELAELAPATVTDPGSFSLTLATDAEAASQEIRRLVGMDDWPSSVLRDQRKALRAAVEAVERLGVLVLQTRDVPISEMRGFSISEWPYPVIVLNGSDWPRPRLFTLLHELMHLALHDGGVCDLHERRATNRTDSDRIEHYCNQVAAAVLIPKSSLERNLQNFSLSNLNTKDLYELSQLYPASSEVILLRLIGLGKVTWESYRRLKPELDEIYADRRAEEKTRQRERDSGPSYYIVKVRNLGQGYVQSVLDAFYARAITSFDVTDYLDIKYDQLPKLQEAVRQ